MFLLDKEISVPSKVFDGIKGSKYYLVNTLPAFKAMVDYIVTKKEVAIDTETSGLIWYKSDVCGLVFGTDSLHNYYVPINHKTGEKQLNIEDIRDDLNRIFLNPNLNKIFWNASFDLNGIKKLGFDVVGPVNDGLIVYHLLDENVDHSLKAAANTFLSKDADKWETILYNWRVEETQRRRSEFKRLAKNIIESMKSDAVLMSWAEQLACEGQPIRSIFNSISSNLLRDHPSSVNKLDDISYDYVPLDIMTPYACADVHYTLLIFKNLKFELMKDSSLVDLYINEMKLLRVLFNTEQVGVKIDKPYLESLVPVLEDNLKEYSEEIYKSVGYTFNIDSDDEVAKALSNAGITLTKLTKGSAEAKKEGKEDIKLKYSVDKYVLERLATKHEFAGKILKYREAQKTKGTYVEGILNLLDEKNYLHTSINQNVVTGRMSMRNPNLQNIPAQDKTIRRAFIVPDPSYLFVFMDLSQVELRLTASYSQDPMLLSCYPFEGKGIDVHTLTTAEIIMGLSYEEVNKQREDFTGHDKFAKICKCPHCEVEFYRAIAKRVNFGIIYGANAETIQRQVSTPTRPVELEKCEEYLEKYFQTYRGVRDWVRSTARDLHRCGRVFNAFGRYRRFPDIKEVPTWKARRYERQATNFLIQGSAADLFKYAIVSISGILKGKKTRMTNLVHDEIQFYFHKDELELVKPIKSALENFNFLVPIVADVSYSNTDWSSKESFGELK